MLTFAEEILLLLLDDERCDFVSLPQTAMECAMAGATLMDLAFMNRIDTDPGSLTILDPKATGNEVLDRTLQILGQATEIRDVKSWIEFLSREEGEWIRQGSLASLINQKILEERNEKFLWVFRTRHYPLIDGRAEREVKRRIMGTLFSDDIPDPRDIALICLVDTCDILDVILAEQEVRAATPRVEQLRKMDLIGREVARAVAEIETSIALAISQTHYPLY